MHIIDRYAYNNRIRKADPSHKVVFALTVVFLCLILNHTRVSLLVVGWMFCLATYLAGIPLLVMGRVLLAEATFLLLAVVGVIISISLSEPGETVIWAWQLGPFWLSSSEDALLQGLQIMTRALGAVSAMNFLAFTTPLVDLIELLHRWRISPILIDLMTVIYRFIFVLVETLHRMIVAQESRLGYHTSYMRAMNNAALLGSRLFMNTLHQSQRLQMALDSRRFEGNLRVLPSAYENDSRLISAGLIAVFSMLLVWMMT